MSLQTLIPTPSLTTGFRLRQLLFLDSPDAQSAVMAAKTANPRWSPAAACNRLPEGWAEFLTLHCACLSALQDGNRSDAYDKSVTALQPFLKVFREDEGSWVILPMHAVVHNLRSAGEAADADARRVGKRSDRLADCGDQLRKCFSVSLQAPGNRDKKLAALDIVNVSIKIYFKLNTLRLCKNLIRTVESRQFAPFESFPAAQRVTYKFYLGRLAVFDDNFVSPIFYVCPSIIVFRLFPGISRTIVLYAAGGGRGKLDVRIASLPQGSPSQQGTHSEISCPCGSFIGPYTIPIHVQTSSAGYSTLSTPYQGASDGRPRSVPFNDGDPANRLH